MNEKQKLFNRKLIANRVLSGEITITSYTLKNPNCKTAKWIDAAINS